MVGNSTLNLVLDLDNTMIHSFVPEYTSSWEHYLNVFQKEKCFLMMFNQPSLLAFVFLRPYLIEFLLQAQKYFKLYVFSAGTKHYVKTILNAITKIYPDIKFVASWGKEDLIENRKCILKHLDVQKTYIIDDLPWYWKQKCFKINPFTSYEEKIRIDEKTNKNTITLDKKFKDTDKYLLDYLDKIIQIVTLDSNL